MDRITAAFATWFPVYLRVHICQGLKSENLSTSADGRWGPAGNV